MTLIVSWYQWPGRTIKLSWVRAYTDLPTLENKKSASMKMGIKKNISSKSFFNLISFKTESEKRYRGLYLPETHSSHLNGPVGSLDSPIQPGWKEPRQTPSLSCIVMRTSRPRTPCDLRPLSLYNVSEINDLNKIMCRYLAWRLALLGQGMEQLKMQSFTIEMFSA